MRKILLLALCVWAPTHTSIAAVEIKTARLLLGFDDQGRPSRIRANGQECVDARRVGAGLFLKLEEKVIRFSKLTLVDQQLTAQTADGKTTITMRIVRHARYIAFHVEKWSGVPKHDTGLLMVDIAMRSGTLKAVPLDYMTTSRSNAGRILLQREALWMQDRTSPKGSFAIYAPTDDDDEDETLFEIWVNEGLPHPKMSGPWTTATAKKWLDRWLDVNRDPSHLNLEASDQTQLRDALPYAKRMNAQAIYLWPGVWRGEYWLSERQNHQVNPEVFPGGQRDLEAYAKLLRQQGLRLKLHYLSGTIGEYDVEFCGKKPDPRLAKWGDGKLAEPIDAAARDIKVRPLKETRLPMEVEIWEAYSPRRLPRFFSHRVVQIGQELIQVGSFENTEGPVWTLKNCRRGLWATEADSHGVEAKWRGLIRPYDQDFVPDSRSDLLETVACRWAELNNRLGTTAVNFDGFENHSHFGRWGSRRFAELVYQHLDHPVTASSSNGRPPRAFFEYRFNRARRLVGRELRDDAGRVALMPDHLSRPATTLDDAHRTLSQAAARTVRSFDIGSYDVKGVPLETLRGHGQTGEIFDLVARWKGVSRRLTVEQRQTLLAVDPKLARLPGAGRHPRGEMLWRLGVEGIQERIVAERTLVGPGFSPLWQFGQEHGPIAPRVHVKLGDTIGLNNADGVAPHRLTIRVDPAFDPQNKHNIDLMPLFSKLKATNETRLAYDQQTLELVEDNRSNGQAIWRTEGLPVAHPRDGLDLSHHRGMGLKVVGDGSGAILVVSVGWGNRRDYVVPIDFKGARWIEIPNGQVAWAQSQWGWHRKAHKWIDFTRVHDLALGLGHVPKGKLVRVRIEKIVALKEVGVALDHPVIQLGDARLSVRGRVPARHFLSWQGGKDVAIHNANWHTVTHLPVTREGEFGAGKTMLLRVTAKGAGLMPWLDVRVQVPSGQSIVVPLETSQ